jgi:hypothetical protein
MLQNALFFDLRFELEVGGKLTPKSPESAQSGKPRQQKGALRNIPPENLIGRVM